MAESPDNKETFAKPPPRNQMDEKKKRYNNIMVRCREHGWECPGIKEKLRELDLKKLQFDEMSCFHYHTAGGINYGNFKDKFISLECPLDFFPIKGGLKKHNSTVQRSNNSRSRSRTKSRSPPRLIKYIPDPTQSKAILDSRIANLEVTQRDLKLHKKASEDRFKKHEERLKILESGFKQIKHCLDKTSNAVTRTLDSIRMTDEEPADTLGFSDIESLERPDIINKTFNNVKLKEEDNSGDFRESERSTEVSIAGANEHQLLSGAITPIYQALVNNQQEV